MYYIAEKDRMQTLYTSNLECLPVTKIKVGPSFITFNKKNIILSDKNNIILYKRFSFSKLKEKKQKNNFFNKKNIYNTVFYTENIDINNLLSFLLKKPDVWYNFFYYNKLEIKNFDIKNFIDLKAKTIGRGFSGSIKRFGFARGPMSHGSKNHRLVGSIGASTTPGRVFKGKKMPGRFGNANKTLKSLILIKRQGNILYIKGSIPGKLKNILLIQPSSL